MICEGSDPPTSHAFGHRSQPPPVPRLAACVKMPVLSPPRRWRRNPCSLEPTRPRASARLAAARNERVAAIAAPEKFDMMEIPYFEPEHMGTQARRSLGALTQLSVRAIRARPACGLVGGWGARSLVRTTACTRGNLPQPSQCTDQLSMIGAV